MDDTKLSVIDHLEEMRVRILKCLVSVALLFPMGYVCSQPTIEWIKRTFCPEIKQLIFLEPMELFFTRVKVGFIMAIAIAFPYIAYHLWKFISPGLFKNERHYISRFVFVSTLLFCTGASFALFFIYPAVLRFSMGMATSDITPMLHVKSVINLAAMLMLGFGVMFQLPILVYTLAVTELVALDTMRKSRPIVVVVVFVASAVLTPPDIISQLAMGIPSLLLFEISLLMSAIALRRKHKREAAERAEEERLASLNPPEEPPTTAPAEGDTQGSGDGETAPTDPTSDRTDGKPSEDEDDHFSEDEYYPDEDDMYGDYGNDYTASTDAAPASKEEHVEPQRHPLRRKPLLGSRLHQKRRHLPGDRRTGKG